MIYLNDRLVPRAEARVSVFDHGFLYGDGIYETLRAYQGIVFKLDEHIERLFRSASMIGLTIPKNFDEIKAAIYETMKANSHSDAYVRLTISRGPGPIGLDPELCPNPTFVIVSEAFKEYPIQYYEKGIKIAIVSVRRNFKDALNPMIKSLNFLNNILAKIEAKNKGAYEAIMLNYRGHVAEGTITNIFFVKNSIICTPELDVGILDGITRMTILNIAEGMGFRIKEGKFTPEDIYSAEEVFISNTTMEVMPVAEVDDKKIGTKPGKITMTLHKAYRKEVDGYLKEKRAMGPSIWGEYDK